MAKRSTLAVSLVVVLFLLSGCSAVLDGGNGSGAGSSDATDAPDGPEGFEYANGFGPDGVTDGQQAVETHQSALKTRGSYMGTYSYDGRGSDGNTSVDVESRVDFESQQGYQRYDVDSPEYSGWGESYYEDDTQYRRSEINGERSGVSMEEQNFTTAELTSTNPIRALLLNVSAYETSVEQRDGTTVAVYEASGTEGVDSFYGVNESADVSAFSATFAVDSEGLVRSATYEITYTDEGEEQTVTMEFELTGLGETSVERPDWVDEA
ncbi:hypothetical protein BRD14_00805 [Halobacteriales archaeon SW_5_68_122]|nr:MAG: hypothetical protein BRD14_00805 [Halobacteriales archaeon SW_5_68_122]